MTTDEINSSIIKSVEDSIMVKQRILCDPLLLQGVRTVAETMAEAFRQQRKIFFLGNGGSAADAQHLAAEFTGRYLREREPLPAIALSVNTSSLTAIGNDYSFDRVFARQLEALGNRGDVVVALSTSGNSTNILCAIEVARRKELITVGMTGESGGGLKKMVEHCLCIPSQETPRIQEAHIMLGHILCEIVEEDLFA